jgi:hypothetical protein
MPSLQGPLQALLLLLSPLCAASALSPLRLGSLFSVPLPGTASTSSAAPSAQLLLALCNSSSPQQLFSFSGSRVQHAASSQCVAFNNLSYNAPLTLQPCDSASPAQAWAYGSSALSNPAPFCGGLQGACIQWSGQESAVCTSSPPALGVGCLLGTWPTAEPTSWNNQLLLDSPSAGMIQMQHSSGGSAGPSGLCAAAVQPAPPGPPPVPTADVLAWSRKEVGCLYDYSMCTMVGSQGCSCSSPPPPADTWRPTDLDTDSWIQSGVSAGCKIHIFVAKHMCGFVSWKSNVGEDIGYNYSSSYSATPVDAVAAFVASVRKVGADPGIYYSLTNNARTNTCGGNILPNPQPGQISVTPEQYDALVLGHLRELYTQWGSLAEV